MSLELPPLRVAVVGAGPAGLYIADQLTGDGDNATAVDLFERLPVPFGLLRYGVAPDHPAIKSASATFQEILDRTGVELFCNVEIGRDVTVDELRQRYDAVVYATGADSSRSLGIEGEELRGSISATDFVKWYNGHPEAGSHDLGTVRSAVVVGAGNVALDVARMLVKNPADLVDTDISADVLGALSDSTVTDVHLVARRGPEHARFTTKELRELGGLRGVDIVVDPAQIPSADPEGLGPVGRRNLKVLREWCGRPETGAPRRIHLHFGARPDRLSGHSDVDGAILETADGTVELEAELVIRAIGYRSRALPGVPFDDDAGTIPHRDHRVLRDGAACPGEYAVGWVKRGPSGILGTNRGDAIDTVAAIVEDAALRRPADDAQSTGALLGARGVPFLDNRSWNGIQRAEQMLGASLGRGRVKLSGWDDLVRAGFALGVDGEPAVAATAPIPVSS